MKPDSIRTAGLPGAAIAWMAGAFAAGALAGGLAVFLLVAQPRPPRQVAATPPAPAQPAPARQDGGDATRAQPAPGPDAATRQPASQAAAPAPAPNPPADPLDALRLAAERGEASAQFELGARHAGGEGVPQDWAAALAWFRRAAEAGIGAAQHNLAVLHERGRGTAPDPVEAVRWYEKAALQGYGPSQFNLAAAHARGIGIPRDMRKAVAWFERAAEQVPQANYALGEIFEDGADIGRNLERARGHYLLAELGGDARATARLAELTPEMVERGTLREVQEQLARLRIDPGGTDGRMGQRTAAAIRRFQKSAGLPEDGRPGQALLERLRAAPTPR